MSITLLSEKYVFRNFSSDANLQKCSGKHETIFRPQSLWLDEFLEIKKVTGTYLTNSFSDHKLSFSLFFFNSSCLYFTCFRNNNNDMAILRITTRDFYFIELPTNYIKYFFFIIFTFKSAQSQKRNEQGQKRQYVSILVKSNLCTFALMIAIQVVRIFDNPRRSHKMFFVFFSVAIFTTTRKKKSQIELTLKKRLKPNTLAL